MSVHIDIVRPGSDTATEMIAALIFMYTPLLILDIFYRDIAVDSFYFEMQNGVTHIQRIHRSTFPNVLQQTGAIGTNLLTNSAPNQRRSTARQRGAATQAKQQSGSKDDSEGDGEPPRPQQLYSYSSFAQILDCSVKTLRNKVSSGLFQKPIQTAFGPRFTQSHLALVLTPQPPAPPPAPQKRGPGRPRIAMSAESKGVKHEC